MVISMLKIRRPLGRLIFNMGIAIPGKTVFLIETAPSYLGIKRVCSSGHIKNLIIESHKNTVHNWHIGRLFHHGFDNIFTHNINIKIHSHMAASRSPPAIYKAVFLLYLFNSMSVQKSPWKWKFCSSLNIINWLHGHNHDQKDILNMRCYSL